MKLTPYQTSKYVRLFDFTRGSIISLTIQLERMMDSIICDYFTESKEKKFSLFEEVVSERIAFNEKCKILKEIIIIKEGKEEFKKRYKGYGTDFDKIAEDRNFFAHCLDVMPATLIELNAKLILISFRNRKRMVYTSEKINDIRDRIMKYVRLLKDFNNRHRDASK